MSDTFSAAGRSFFSSYLRSSSPSFSLLFPSQALFYERHVKHTGRVKQSTVEMLIVFFIRVENVKKKEKKRKKRKLPRSMGKMYFKGRTGCSVSTM